ncbi:acyltransferase family protein [Enterobacter roggenkampii]|mgnify:CR=1 FL=1|jgi:peptidoglycan/LPS O-acetylase OafA/YrhL|uniref:acyltransferase family protein n=1 Tax=Enterobacter roggenkampii TaxID=1812935 RepID=UPI002003C5C0|nr:acyltransferase [Enterobacter roggenkampii]MCK6871840.1 acyltransferase [Enterobacter roggenkampii]HDR2701943.1 acyltransferase [Enterobacter roggenkampii]HDT5217545.1 acyltransferase [Enterobacter roggenkampii]
MLKSIHYARGMAALLVVLFHFSFMFIGKMEPYNTIFLNGGFGVDFFFLISGFIISFVTQEKIKLSTFLLKRFFRIYPLFLFILIISSIFLIRYNVHPLWSIIKSGLLILQDYNKPAPEFDFNLIGPAWTLSYEAWFYLIFGISMFISHKKRIEVTTALLLVQVFSLQFVFSGSISLNSSYVGSLGDSSYLDHAIKFFSTSLHLEFIAGMWMFKLFNRGSLNFPGTFTIPFSLALAISSVALYFSKVVSGTGFTSFYVIAIPLFIAMILCEANFNIPKSKTLSLLGDISFSIYISHFFIMYLFLENFPDFLISSWNIIKLVIPTIVAILFAYILHKSIEVPIIKAARKFLNIK